MRLWLRHVQVFLYLCRKELTFPAGSGGAVDVVDEGGNMLRGVLETKSDAAQVKEEGKRDRKGD